MYLIYIIKLIILACNIIAIQCADNMKLSDKRSCANKHCSVPISEGRAIINFGSPTQGILSFQANQKVTVYSKDAGENINLWGVEIDGKRGYVPKHLVRESKILFNGVLGFLEDVEESKDLPNIKPDTVKEAYEVIDGTTVYSGGFEDINQLTKAIPDAKLISNTLQVDKDVEDAKKIEINPALAASLLDSIKPPENVDSAAPRVVNDVKDSNNSVSVEEVTKSQILNYVEEKLTTDKEVVENVIPDHNADEIDKNIPKDIDFKEEETNFKELELVKHVEVYVNATSNLDDPVLNIVDAIKESTEYKENTKQFPQTSNEINSFIESFNLGEKDLKEIKPKVLETKFVAQKDKFKEIPKATSEETTETLPISTQTESLHVSTQTESVPVTTETESLPVSTDTESVALSIETESVAVSTETESTVTENPAEMVESSENDTFYEEEQNDNSEEDYHLNMNNVSEEANLDIDITTKENNKSDLTLEETKSENEQAVRDFQNSNNVDEILSEIETSINKAKNILENSNIDRDINSNSEDITTENTEDIPEEKSEGFFSQILSNLFGSAGEDDTIVSYPEENVLSNKQNIVNENSIYNEGKSLYEESGKDYLLSNIDHATCSANGELNNCDFHNAESLKQTTAQNFPSIEEISNSLNEIDFANFYDIVLVLSVTGGTTVVFFIAYILIDKCRREGPLIAKINRLEKALLVSRKENVLLVEKNQSEIANTHLLVQGKSNQEIVYLQAELQFSLKEQSILQDQMQSLEKELENSTEVGLELNKMISDMLSSQNGSDVLTTHVEQLQNQLVDQHNDIAKYKEKLNEKTMESHELQLELEINKKKVNDLQTEIDNMLLNVLIIEEERDDNQQKYDLNLAELSEKLRQDNLKFNTEIKRLNTDLQKANKLSAELTRNFEIKAKEFDLLKDSMKEVKAMKNNSDALKSLLDMSSVKAELHQLKTDNVALNSSLQVEQQKTYTFEKQAEIAIQEAKLLKVRFDEADKEKVEAQTKLEVLGNYFKEKEGQLQKELSKHEAMWNEKQGEASSTVERIKFMQEELQNYKSQNETLKHEILSQEVDLKSQISVLEKKSHEYWLNARQVERKLEDAKQESAQLRNRLTLTYMDDKTNGTIEHMQQPLSPLHHIPGMGMVDHNDSGLIARGDSTASPPSMLYGGVRREPHNIHSMPPPPPFLPPPPFMPPPPMNGPPPPLFMHHPMPPPPLTQGPGSDMFGPPIDHRPPPLGRISSPPIPDRGSARYSPSQASYSPYDDRHTPPSPNYDDDDDIEDDMLYRRGGQHRGFYGDSYDRHNRQLESPQLSRGAKNGGKGSTMSSGGSNTSADKGNLNTSAGQYHHNTNV